MPERAGHGQRDPDDYYATTVPLARLICARIKTDFGVSEPRSILEPGCGAGTFLRAIRQTWPEAPIHGIELHPDLAGFAESQGFEVKLGNVLTEKLGTYDLILGNPPFRYSDDFVPVLLQSLSPKGVLAFVLRLNYLAGQKRYDSIWRRAPPARVYALPARPGFTPDGKTDATDYMVAAWQKDSDQACVLSWLDNRSVLNKWGEVDEFPDPRRVPRPKRSTLLPGVTLSEWPPKTSNQSMIRYAPRDSNFKIPLSRRT